LSPSSGFSHGLLPIAGPSGETILGLGILNTAAYSPDGHFIAAGGSLGVMLWNADTGELHQVLFSTVQNIQSLAFTPDGTRLVAVGSNQSIVWEVASGLPLLNFPAEQSISALTVSPGGYYACIGNYDPSEHQYIIEMWSLKSGTQVNQIGWHSSPIQSIDISPDSQYLLTSGLDGYTRVWDLFNGCLLESYPIGGKAIFSPDTMQILIQSADDGNAYLISRIDKDNPHMFTHGNGLEDGIRDQAIFGIGFLSDGRQVVTISGSKIAAWDVETGNSIRTIERSKQPDWGGEPSSTQNKYSQDCYVLSPDRTSFLCVDRTFVNRTYSVSMWSLESGEHIRTFGDYTPPVVSAAFSPDGDYVCLGGGRSVQVWSISEGLVWRLYEANLRGKIASVCFSQDGRLLGIVDSMGITQIRDTRTWEKVQSIQIQTGISASFSPDGTLLLTGGHSTISEYAYLWNIATGERIRSFREMETQRTSFIPATIQSTFPNWWNPAVFSPDGNFILTGCISEFTNPESLSARLWNASTGTLIRTFTQHTDAVVSVAYSPNGHSIATGSKDQTVKIWDVETGLDTMTLTGHQGTVYSVAFSPDARYLLTSSDEGNMGKPVILWDARSGQELAVIHGHEARINATAFSPDGQYILTAGDDGTVRIWNLILTRTKVLDWDRY